MNRLNLKNDEITVEDIQKLFASKFDAAGHHMLWVSNNGDIWLEVIPDSLAPNQYAKLREAEMKFRFETFTAELGYVGVEAAKHRPSMETIRNAIVRNWESNSRGYIESY